MPFSWIGLRISLIYCLPFLDSLAFFSRANPPEVLSDYKVYSCQGYGDENHRYSCFFSCMTSSVQIGCPLCLGHSGHLPSPSPWRFPLTLFFVGSSISCSPWFRINSHFCRGYPSVVFWKIHGTLTSRPCMFENVFILLSHLFHSLATYSILGWKFFSFRNSKAFSYCFLLSVFLRNLKLFWYKISETDLLYMVCFCFCFALFFSPEVCKLFSMMFKFHIMCLG